MAGLHTTCFRRPTTPPSCSISSHILLLLTLPPLTLASFAFLLQWRGGVHIHPTFLDMDSSAVSSGSPPSHTDCATRLLGHTNNNNPSLSYYRHWKLHFSPNHTPKICIATTTIGGLEQILPWIFYHKLIGVSSFFLFVEGIAASPNASTVLQTIPGVQVIPRSRELEELQAKSWIWNNTGFARYMNKPCNYELFVKQSLNMEMAIVMARESGMDWIIHLDTDELIHPAGTQDYSLRELLADVPRDVDMVIFTNYESTVERDDIKDPFSEVSLFKKNSDHLPKNVYFGNYKEASRGYPNYFLTYVNGKSAARIQDHLQSSGPHRWHLDMKPYNEIMLEEAAVLHYTYTKFSDLTSRRDRCGCKPTKDVERCFMLKFDRLAFIIASAATKEEMLQWYQERVVWTDKKLILKLLRKGMLTRIYAPMVIVQSLRESGVFHDVIAKAAETTLF